MLKLTLKKGEAGNHLFSADGKEEEFMCVKCEKKITEGYLCENNDKIILCRSCQVDFPMFRCFHDKRGEHRHIKFTKTDGNKTQQRAAL